MAKVKYYFFSYSIVYEDGNFGFGNSHGRVFCGFFDKNIMQEKVKESHKGKIKDCCVLYYKEITKKEYEESSD